MQRSVYHSVGLYLGRLLRLGLRPPARRTRAVTLPPLSLNAPLPNMGAVLLCRQQTSAAAQAKRHKRHHHSSMVKKNDKNDAANPSSQGNVGPGTNQAGSKNNGTK
jgi:hypothetical protein